MMGIKQGMAVAVVMGSFAAMTNAAVLAQWTFETNTPADLNNSAAGPSVTAEVGTGTLQGVHANAGSDWTTPAGNGSANSYSVNTWELGDYTQFSTSALGFKDIQITFDATSSGTGPRDFKLQYSTDGVSFTDFTTYQVLANASPNPTWNGTTSSPIYSLAFDLSSITALNDDASIFFRLTMNSTTSASGATVAAGGTSRVDNVTVNGNVIPEPATMALLALGSGMMLLRRRQA